VIIGAGAVGGTIGVRLSRAGRDVTLVARGAHAEVMRERGLTLHSPDGTVDARLPVVTDPADPADLVLPADAALILAVKSQDTEAAVRRWADVPVAGGGTAGERLALFAAQNGVANERAALRYFDRVHGICVWLPATHLKPGVVVSSAQPYPGLLHLGRYPAGSDDASRAVAGDLEAAGFLAPLRDDVMRWKYGKLLRNLGNGLQALLGGQIPDHLSAAVLTEGEAVLAAAGIAHTSLEEEAAERGDQVEVRPVHGQPRTGGSTWQSLARGAGSTEVDHLNGEIVLLGRLHGVPTPVNAAVQLAVRRAARERIGAGEFPLAALEEVVG
jgi:2-dehydropantoate 2-reductase